MNNTGYIRGSSGVSRKVIRPKCSLEFHTATESYTVNSTDPTRDMISVYTEKTMSQASGSFIVNMVARRDDKGMTWKDKINPMDLVVIRMARDVTPLQVIMVGLVDQVRESFSIDNNGKVTRNIFISGRDFGKILERALVYWFPSSYGGGDSGDIVAKLKANAKLYSTYTPGANPALTGPINWQSDGTQIFGVNNYSTDNAVYELIHGSNNVYAYSSDVVILPKGNIDQFGGLPNFDDYLFMMGNLGLLAEASGFGNTPADMLDLMMRKLVYPTFQTMDFKLDKQTVNIQQLLRYKFSMFAPANITNTITVPTQYQGSAWDYMQQVIMSPFMELFLDTRSDYQEIVPDGVTQRESSSNGATTFDESKIVLFLRNTPFTPDLWNKLPRESFSWKDVIQFDLGRTDSQVANVLWTVPQLPTADSMQPIPFAFPPMIDYPSAQKYGLGIYQVVFRGLLGGETDAFTQLDKLNNLIKTYYHNNPEFEGGRILMVGNPSMRIGIRTLNTSVNMEYYVEGVVHNFVNYQQYTTTTNVTRGWPA